MLLNSRFARSSSAPSSDILALRGRRMVFASETDAHRNFSTAQVKWLSGGDVLIGRGLQAKHETRFKPTHTLFMLTNNLPHAPESDHAFWERVHVVPFRVSFVRREVQGQFERLADIYMAEKLKQEAPGILAWLVRGCLQWQAIGLDPPAEVVEASKQYRKNEDDVTLFIERCCVLGDQEKCGSAEIYNIYKRWWKAEVNSQGKGMMSHKALGQELRRKFPHEKKGNIRYHGVRPLEDLEFGE